MSDNPFQMSRSTEQEVEELKVAYRISEQDLKEIKKIGKTILPNLNEYIDRFYEWLKTLDEWDRYFSDPEKVKAVKGLQYTYWQTFFSGKLDCDYVDSRRNIGRIHAGINLSLPAYSAGVSRFMDIFSSDFKSVASIGAVSRLVYFDFALTIESYNRITNETIAEQGNALMEMSTPVTSIWEGVLLLPIVGILDSKRAQDLMHSILLEINKTQSKVVILDISGVAVVDTAVANHIIKITKATKLMGCNCIVSGISPAIAQTIVELGIDVGTISTTASLKDALVFAFKAVGVHISKQG